MNNENQAHNTIEESGLINCPLRVTPEYLRMKAQELDANVTEAKLITTQMTDVADNLVGRIWSGEAQRVYIGKFRSLQDSINQYTTTLKKHAAGLAVIADQYRVTDEEAGRISAALPADIFTS